MIPNFSFEVIELSLRGTLGVSVLDTGSGRKSGWLEDDRFPLNSTFKFLLAGAVLMEADGGREDLERRVEVHRKDLLPWSPVTETAVGTTMSVADLCAAAMTRSDNAAANLLLAQLGGPKALTATLRGLGDVVTRIDRLEPEINNVAPGDPRDTTTPASMISHLKGFLLEPRLKARSRSLMLDWMVANTTGDARIRAGVPPGWTVGDRTGSGPRGETSDIAIVLPPDRAPMLMAVYIAGTERTNAESSARHAELARIATSNLALPPHDLD
ncbi:class A beta-lactamase [Limimaricola cinnabarinus]|uniref:class A beta-lactamase n=1 Tax=Limimaricola cinnabarinus TaxID=1125964 RepID=UPI00249224AF|nr:class A beta-lactamase [Limimaricola cinnabarinus]